MKLYIAKLVATPWAVVASASLTALYAFFFPEQQYLYSALAVLGIMALDLATKMVALRNKAGGWVKAFKTRTINSAAFYKGTLDKLIIFAVMMIICGMAYRLTLISEIAIWFTQFVYLLMFFRDLLSIIENLNDAGVGGLGIFKRAVKKKMAEYVELDEEIEKEKKNEN